MKIIVTGATGMVGAEVIRQAIADTEITSIVAIVRGALDIEDPKLKTVVHKDFLHYDSIAHVFAEADAVLWCLGISQTQVSKQQYITITYEYTIAAATAMLKANPSIRLVFVSGGGADSTEKSRTLFARVKGQTENALRKMNFKSLVIARPGGIQPIHPNKNAPFLYKLFLPLFPIMSLLTPSKMIKSDRLARALLRLAKERGDGSIVENAELLRIA